jgi:hypothetical protein
MTRAIESTTRLVFTAKAVRTFCYGYLGESERRARVTTHADAASAEAERGGVERHEHALSDLPAGGAGQRARARGLRRRRRRSTRAGARSFARKRSRAGG